VSQNSLPAVVPTIEPEGLIVRHGKSRAGRSEVSRNSLPAVVPTSPAWTVAGHGDG
jgi:hypothetical protein